MHFVFSRILLSTEVNSLINKIRKKGKSSAVERSNTAQFQKLENILHIFIGWMQHFSSYILELNLNNNGFGTTVRQADRNLRGFEPVILLLEIAKSKQAFTIKKL